MNKRTTDWVGNPDAWMTLVPEQTDEGPLITYIPQEVLDISTVFEEIINYSISSHILSPRQVVSVLDELAGQIEDYG